MAQIAVNGTNLYYEERGKGTPILFIHGICGDARVWSDQMERLSSHLRCIAYDRRGHTRSPLGEIKERTVELHADDAAEFIQQMGIGPCIIVGSSGGARIGIDVVRRYPELIKGAALSEPPLFALDKAGAIAFVNELKPAITKAMATGVPKAAVDAFFRMVCPGLWGGLSEAMRDRYRDNHSELFGDLQMPLYQVSTEELARIRRPCLIISGSESLPLFQKIARMVSNSIPDSRFVELAGSGHVTYYEKPVEFAAAVLTFTEGLNARGA